MAALEPAAFAFQAIGSIVQGIGDAQAARQRSAQAERAAQVGRVRADQLDTQMRSDLAATIANVRAIRASAGGTASPTEAAVIEREEAGANRERRLRCSRLTSASGPTRPAPTPGSIAPPRRWRCSAAS